MHPLHLPRRTAPRRRSRAFYPLLPEPRTDRRRHQPRSDDRFDSDFERDVYRHLIARGYRVKVQHQVGRFRIDLVVEGRRGRLAVELDGDAYHGPDRWEADRNRQAILERLGWTFHRIRGSAYYRDPDAALTSLWDRLDTLGIQPSDNSPDTASSPVPIGTETVEDGSSATPGAEIKPTESAARRPRLCPTSWWQPPRLSVYGFQH